MNKRVIHSSILGILYLITACKDSTDKIIINHQEYKLIDVSESGQKFTLNDTVVWYMNNGDFKVTAAKTLSKDSQNLLLNSFSEDVYLIDNKELRVFEVNYLFKVVKPQSMVMKVLNSYLTLAHGQPNLKEENELYAWAVSGDTIAHKSQYDLIYRGVTFEGRMVESSYVNKDTVALQYTVGVPHQVVPAFSKLIHTETTLYSKYKLLVSPKWAYGDQGSSTGIVQPEDYIYYELELN